MLNTGYSVQEIIEYFKTYVPVKERIARKFKEYQELTEKLKNGEERGICIRSEKNNICILGDVSASEKMRMLKDIMAGQNLSEKVNWNFQNIHCQRSLDKILYNSYDKFFEGLPGLDEDTIWR